MESSERTWITDGYKYVKPGTGTKEKLLRRTGTYITQQSITTPNQLMYIEPVGENGRHVDGVGVSLCCRLQEGAGQAIPPGLLHLRHLQVGLRTSAQLCRSFAKFHSTAFFLNTGQLRFANS
jgi:hypothetical protein